MGLPGHLVAIELDGDDRRAVVVDADGTVRANRVVPPERPGIQDVLAGVAASGPTLVLVEEPAALDGELPAAAGAAGVDVVYVPGAGERRAADIELGRGREIGRRGALLAAAARRDPDALLAATTDHPDAPGIIERDRSLHDAEVRYLGQVHLFLEQRYPALNGVLGPHLDHPVVLALLERYSTPDDARTAGRRRLRAMLRDLPSATADALLEALMDALARPESNRELPNVERVLPNRTRRILDTLAERAALSTRYAALLPALGRRSR